MNLEDLKQLVENLEKMLPQLQSVLAAASQPSAIEELKKRGIPVKDGISEETAKTILDSLTPDESTPSPEANTLTEPKREQASEPAPTPQAPPEPVTTPEPKREQTSEKKPTVATKPTAATADTTKLLAQLTASRNHK